ncbi:S8 family peptidase [Solirubrobacter soli]|uniref:S8 family peptidase n=1 Tax=Solirubrobacter soli TaxID=363832 RepID=UPI0012FB63A9|nr:S8 family serine peptidase [Solirubrobacter soli]
MKLPGAVTASAARADPDTWIVGARAGRTATAIAQRFHARQFGFPQTGSYTVARGQARAFAAELKAHKLLYYAEPNVLRRTLRAIPDDPLSGPPNDWRRIVADPALTPPPVTPTSPAIALVDAAADMTHPEWTGDPNVATLPGTPVTDSHGTATMSVAVAPQNGIGILGVWPGARALNVPLATVPGTDGEISCDASGDGIAKAVQNGASVINMSYSSPSRCAAEWVQIYFAIAKGIIPVAAAGNEFEEGNPIEFPASLPHVVTVAATTRDDKSAEFSNANAAIDLSAPGVDIMTAVPLALPDPDKAQDGYSVQSGTSFSAPMVSAAIAWVRAARPDLTPDRVVQAIRLGARDVEKPGWDPLTGFGVLNVGNSLDLPESKLPIHDPLEPNDNIVWVDGTAFGKPAPAVWNGGTPARVNGLLDNQEDPIDVYRIVIPGQKTAKISVIPRFGDPQVEVFTSSAISVNDEDRRVAYGHKAGAKKTERVSVRNGGKSKHSYYIAIRPQGNSRYQEREYTLRVG